jgi:hypothetical protein
MQYALGQLELEPNRPKLTEQKSDLWLHEAASSSEGVRGAIGFRQIRDSSIFATGQPTEDALSTILKGVHERCPNVNCVLWICLREEPLVMINGMKTSSAD